MQKTVKYQYEYPKTTQVDTIDEYFGVQVKDPYRWLEDDRSKETEAWVKTQNKTTFISFKCPYKEELKERLKNYGIMKKYSLKKAIILIFTKYDQSI